MQSLFRNFSSCTINPIKIFSNRLYSYQIKPFVFTAIPNEPFKKDRIVGDYGKRYVQAKKFIKQLMEKVHSYDLQYSKKKTNSFKQVTERKQPVFTEDESTRFVVDMPTKNKHPEDSFKAYKTAESQLNGAATPPRSPIMPNKFKPKGTFQSNDSNIPLHILSF